VVRDSDIRANSKLVAGFAPNKAFAAKGSNNFSCIYAMNNWDGDHQVERAVPMNLSRCDAQGHAARSPILLQQKQARPLVKERTRAIMAAWPKTTL